MSAIRGSAAPSRAVGTKSETVESSQEARGLDGGAERGQLVLEGERAASPGALVEHAGRHRREAFLSGRVGGGSGLHDEEERDDRDAHGPPPDGSRSRS